MAVSAPVRIGLIGCGGNQRGAHLPRLTRAVEAGDAALVACCDPVPENVALVEEKLPGIRTHAEHLAMLATEDLDAVCISTPHTLHYEHIMDSFAAGCHVLTEKPMVCSIEEAQRVIQARDETGLQLQVGYQRHFTGGYRWARDYILSGQAGPVRFINAWQCQWWRSAQSKKGNSWRIVPHLGGGGQLNDSGSHMLDILLWMTELQPTSVGALIDHRGLDVDVLSALNVDCDGGAILNIAIVGDSVRPFDEEVTIWCDNATIQMVGPQAQLKLNRLEEPQKLIEIPAEDLPAASDPDRNFIDAVLGRAAVEVPAECGLRVIQLTEAAWESGRTGQRTAIRPVA